MNTREEERVLLKGCFRDGESNVIERRVKRDGVLIVFKRSVGFISVESDIVGAPCSAGQFKLIFARQETDNQIASKRIDEINEYLAWEQEEAEEAMQELEENWGIGDDGGWDDGDW